MSRSGKIHALLSTARVANIPSVVSNVWVGVALTVATNNRMGDRIKMDIHDVPWPSVCCLTLTGICLYAAGNFLNDWVDRDWDKKHRPERALPTGLFPPALYLGLALLLASVGLGLATWENLPAGVVAMGIIGCIVIYTVWHKRSAWAVVPMGLCRALLPILGALGMMENQRNLENIIGYAIVGPLLGGGLFFYIVGLSMSARCESKSSPSSNETSFSIILFVLAATPLLFAGLLTGHASWATMIGIAPYLVWLGLCRTLFRRPISKYVSALLAGIPLVDWMFLLPFSLTSFFHASPTMPQHPLEWVSLTLPPLAFIAALLLQRLAPAT
ncbi:MAG: UbiA family prenyltransferase [Luteolibacter sp.]